MKIENAVVLVTGANRGSGIGGALLNALSIASWVNGGCPRRSSSFRGARTTQPS